MAGIVRCFRLFSFLALVFLISGCGPEAKKETEAVREVAVSELERNEEQLFARGETEPFSGWMLELYEEGKMKSRSGILDGRLDGLSEGWFPDGQLQVREYFRLGIAHGTRVRWFPDGTIQSEAEIVEGKLHGTFRRWHPNGVLAEKTEMKRGQANGVSIGFFPSGYVRARVVLEDGNVVEQEFWQDGEMREEAWAETRKVERDGEMEI